MNAYTCRRCGTGRICNCSLPPQPLTNTFCSHCQISEAEVMCYCTFPGTSLCSSCMPTHQGKPGSHCTFPLAARNYITTAQHYSWLLSTKSRLEAAKTLLGQDLERIAACESVINRRCEASIIELNSLRQVEMRKLDKARQDIMLSWTRAMEEFEPTLYDPNCYLRSALGAEIRKYCLGQPCDLAQFTFAEEPAVPLQPKWVSIHYQTKKGKKPGKKGPAHYFPLFSPTTVSRYQVATNSATAAVQLSALLSDINEYSICTALSFEEAFVADANGRCFIVNMNTGQVHFPPQVQQPRVLFGLIHRKGRVYIMGGSTQTAYLPVCESISIVMQPPHEAMSSLLYARDCFTPVVYKKDIYVVGGRGNAKLPSERYSFLEQRFSPLDFSLSALEPTLCVVLGDVLVAGQGSLVVRYELKTGTRRQQRSQGAGWSCAPPYIYGDFLYTVQKGAVTRESLKRYR